MAFRSLIVLAFFCASVNTGLFDFDLAFVFFAGFRLALGRGFAVDFAVGLAFGVVFFAAGFLAALVFDVVGAFLAAVVVLPVCALGRDTGLVAYMRHNVDFWGSSRSRRLSMFRDWKLRWRNATRCR